MSRNHKFFFDKDGIPKARGPAAEKVLMTFLEVDVQGSDHICRELMDDVTAIEDESDDSREFIGNAHTVTIMPETVVITLNPTETATQTSENDDVSATAISDNNDPYHVPLKHFREILEDWEAFILDDQLDDQLGDDSYV